MAKAATSDGGKTMDTQCPWCGEEVMGLVHPTNYDVNLEAHVSECEPFIAEQGGF